MKTDTGQGNQPDTGLAGQEPVPTIPGLHSRTYRLTPPRNAWIRWGRRLADRLEARMAAASRVGDRPVMDPSVFPWVHDVERDWRLVREELDAVMPFREQMPSFQDILKEVGKIQADQQWKTFFLKGVGMDCTANAARCPRTMQVLGRIPGVKTAFFSILSPGKHIPAHRGPFVGVLRLHLALMVPEPREKCRIRIADQIHSWEEGRCLVFDDTYNHEVWNDTDGYRVVLFVDFARPMRRPYGWLNEWLLGLATLAPFIREANDRQTRWERAFYRS
jgi:aspartyl/asparaginyl beta-hydroxylase (cupin superfamily)